MAFFFALDTGVPSIIADPCSVYFTGVFNRFAARKSAMARDVIEIVVRARSLLQRGSNEEQAGPAISLLIRLPYWMCEPTIAPEPEHDCDEERRPMAK